MFGNDRQEREASAAAARGQAEALRMRVAELETINEAHRKLNGELRSALSAGESREAVLRERVSQLAADLSDALCEVEALNDEIRCVYERSE